jgi:hypothetical protein
MRAVRKKDLSTVASHRRLRLFTTLVLVLLCVSAVFQSGPASAQNANPARDLPDAPVQRGETFDVTITFIAPYDDFNSIGLVDEVPAGWTIQVDTTWCTPNADQANIDGNQSQYAWYGPYSSGESFTALYKVTVPANAEFDTYLFNGQLGYNIASSTRIFKDIGGDSSTDVTVADPSTVPTPTPAPSPQLTPTPTSSLTPTPSSTLSPTLTPTPTPSLTPVPIPATGEGFGPGAWTGIGIGILVGIMLLVGLVVWIVKRQRIKEA